MKIDKSTLDGITASATGVKVDAFALGDAIEIVDKSKITGAVNVENGECFIVVGIQRDTPTSHGFITIVDNNAEDFHILESEFGGIQWIA